MSSRVYSRRHLTVGAASVHAGAVHETALSLAGRARHEWESLTGAPAVAGEPASAEANPQNEIGDDMSGPPFGAAPLLSVWWWCADSEAANARWRANTMRGIGSESRILSARLWNRPHAVAVDGTAPLDRLLFSWRAKANSASSSTFNVNLRNLITGQIHTFSRTIATTATTTYSETGELIGVAPGLNGFEIEVVRASGSALLTVHTFALTVTAKRRHGLTFPG